MVSKYVDTTAITQVIGIIYKTPQLLDYTDRYKITEEDFQEQFHKIVFGTIYKLYNLGTEHVTLKNIHDFLSNRAESFAIYNTQNGDDWILHAEEHAQPAAFDYYYARLKKMSLLRAYDKYGVDVSDIYDPNNILDLKKSQLQEEQLDNMSIEDIALKIDYKIDEIKSKYINDTDKEAIQAGEGVHELIDRLKQYPEVGLPLYGPLINTVTRGARLKKFYLRSAPTGVGKTRSMIADACFLGCNSLYDDYFGWIKSGVAQPALYITTEQDKEEIQTMMLAFLANVNEEHILNGSYEGDEEERVLAAADLLTQSPLYIEMLPDFSLMDIEDIIKKNIREHNVNYVFFDYIHSSLKILSEITKQASGVKLREDNILFMLSIRLKDLCNKYGIFILSSTQLNGDYTESKTPDQNLLRGAKAIADKIDVGMVTLPVAQEDIDGLECILATNIFDKPNLKISIYKNRRGRYKGIYLWCKADLGTCRVRPMFATNYNYELIKIDDIDIKVDEDSSAF